MHCDILPHALDPLQSELRICKRCRSCRSSAKQMHWNSLTLVSRLNMTQDSSLSVQLVSGTLLSPRHEFDALEAFLPEAMVFPRLALRTSLHRLINEADGEGCKTRREIIHTKFGQHCQSSLFVRADRWVFNWILATVWQPPGYESSKQTCGKSPGGNHFPYRLRKRMYQNRRKSRRSH